jgi:hypothetical protein
MWYEPYMSAANMKTLINTMRGNQAKMRMHAQKFGLKTTKFSESMIEMREISPYSLEAVPLMSTLPVHGRNGADTSNIGHWPTGKFDADGSEATKWWFRDDPNENDLNALRKLLHAYNATYNPYGELFTTATPPSSADMCGLRADYTEGTEFLGTTFIQQLDFILLFYAAYCNDTDIALEWQGTDVTNGIIKSGVTQYTWPLSVQLDLKYGTGLDEGDSDAILINYIRKLLF